MVWSCNGVSILEDDQMEWSVNGLGITETTSTGGVAVRIYYDKLLAGSDND